jgi:PAS domain S-box-containing protein
MNHSEFQLRGVGDPRLAVHATSALPAWLWSTDGTRILWANPVGARLFGAANGAVLAERLFGPADSHRRQVAQLANRLPSNGAVRLERLRGFGAAYGRLATCGCARLDFADGSHGILIAAAEPVGRPMPLVERLQRLVEGVDSPIAAFARDGMFIGASDAARSLLGFHDLSEAGLGQARSEALKQGRVELPVGIGHLVLQRVGSGADVGLVALLATATPPIQEASAEAEEPKPAPSNEALAGFALVDEFAEPLTKTAEATKTTEATETAEAAPADPVSPPTPDYEAPANSGEAPAEFALVDEFSSQPEQPIAGPPPQTPEPTREAQHDESVRHDEPAHHDELAHHNESAHHDEAPPQELLLLPQELLPQEPPPQEPSPYVEAVADEPSPEAAAVDAEAATPNHDAAAAAAPVAPPPAEPIETPPWHDEPAPPPRSAPLRFIWQMDADGRFSLGSDEFTHLIGSHTAEGFGRLWSEIAETFGLDPEGRVLKAVATRDTWSGITLNWPVDGGGRLPVELSGLPLYDRARNFVGYRGFGVCRDLDGLARLAALRRYELFNVPPPAPQALSAGVISAELPANSPVSVASDAGLPDAGPAPSTEPELSAPIASETSHQTDLATHDLENQELETQVDPKVETPKETPKNVLPFRPIGDTKSPVLTPVENNAFNELARQLAERLERQSSASIEPTPSDAASETSEAVVAQPTAEETEQTVEETATELAEAPVQETASPQPGWLAHPEPPARGESRRDKALLDLLPVGVLIYRLDRLLYANTAFLQRMGYHSLHALEEAGGLDALYVEPGVSTASSTSDTGTPVTISGSQSSGQDGSAEGLSGGDLPPQASEAHLYTIAWDDEQALALIFSAQPAQGAHIAAALAEPVFVEPVLAEPAVTYEPSASEAFASEPSASEPSPVGHANAEELAAILDTTAEGILMFDAEGNINSCNRSAEALFGHDGADLVQRNLADLFAPESAPAVRDYLESVKGADISSLLEQGRDLLARVDGGGLIPVSMTMGRTQAHGPNFFAVFRDLSQAKKSESELREARRLAERAANAKSDMLARISHEVRTPLNAIIGFAEVMIGERFGALGNERYVEYMKDIRASGERVIAIINDLLDLSRIETGKLDLAFTNQNLNDLVEQCVAVMQPQANRERIIIRTSLAHMLPHVVADARALRQITLNLIGNSIHLANAGGQVIVSTALSDFGEVVLRVRDTGHGLNDNEVAAAMEPFRTTAPSDQASDSSGVSLSLTKALVEANRAQFQIKTGGRSGTLIEVVFSHAIARA